METIYEIITSPSSSVKEAMQQMTRSKKGVLLVLNDVRQLVGVLSDGDIRRGILNNVLMMSPVSQIMNTDPLFATGEKEALNLLKQKSSVIIPVIDTNRKLKAIAVQEGANEFVLKMSEPENAGDGEDIFILIPARGGSKRIPHKNLQKLGGYSLVARAIRVAQEAFPKAYILVSTDDPQIAKEAERMGANVPWLRPAELAADNSGTFEVVVHALSWAAANLKQSVQALVLLEPTAPLRNAFHIRESVSLLQAGDADSVVSISEVPHVFNPEEVLTINAGGLLHPYIEERKMHNRLLRGKQKSVFVQNGITYVIRPDTILKKNNLYGDKVIPYMVEWKYFADIDEPLDLIAAESKLKILV